jgi:hypothetical protein
MSEQISSSEGAPAPRFDFQALAARASSDNPDALLFQAVERLEDSRRALSGARAANRGELAYAWLEAERVLAGITPRTPEGAAAKLRAATLGMSRSGLCDLRRSAMCDAIKVLAALGAPRRRQRTRRGAA